MRYPISSRIKYRCYKNWESSNALDNFYPVRGQIINCVSTVSYKPVPTQNRLQSVNTSISETFGLRVSVAGRRFCFQRNLHLGFRPMTNHIRMNYVSDFSCHYWHPFGVRITFFVSKSVVACGYYIFSINKLSSTGA